MEAKTKTKQENEYQSFSDLKAIIPLSSRICLTFDEAAAYSGIGVNKLREYCYKHEEVIIWVGSRRMVKREALERLLNREYSL